VGVGAIWLVVNAAGGMDDVFAALQRVNPWWLVPAAAFEALAYVLSGIRLRRLAGPDARLTTTSATEIELVMNGLGLLTPASPAEGLAWATTELARRGLSRRRIGLILGFSQWFSSGAFLLANAVNLLVIAATRDLPVDSTWPLIIAPSTLVVLVVTGLLVNRSSTAERLAVTLGPLRFWKPRSSHDELRAAGNRFHADAMHVVGDHQNRITLGRLSLGSLLADIACLWFILIAADAHVGFDVALLAAGAAAVSAIVPFLPGGFGVVEAVMPAVIHWYGPPVSAALAGALLYRAIGTFLPAAAGTASLAALRAHRS
jgi:uncharacterized protein (TIRG00374 family)